VFTPAISLVHADARGEMYSISLPGDQELMLLHSKRGSLRGGHSHDVPECVMVLTGGLRYRKRTPNGVERTEELKAGDCAFTPAGEIHLGQFLEDTWITELKLAAKGQWSQENYTPWRTEVEHNAG